MSKADLPVIAALKPVKVELQQGKEYFWCLYGKSRNQPFCDGRHAGSGIVPLKFTAEKSGSAALCQCKSTANAPFCDGSHVSLGELKEGDPAPLPSQEVPVAVPTPEEPLVARIHALARDGLSRLGSHGEMGAMGVARKDLPHWDDIQILPAQLARFFGASVELMQVLARACGHSSLSDFSIRDITSWKREMADLSGIRFAGPGSG